MRHHGSLLFALVVVFLATCASWAQAPKQFTILVPDTSVVRTEDRGLRAHTNHLIRLDAKPAFVGTSPAGETPATIRPVYNLTAGGGSQTIAIVDAFDYPTAASDLNTFSSTLGLPAMPDCGSNGNVAPCFRKVFAAGRKPRTNCGWAQEAALDIEWAHAMAPNARIVLVEAASNSFANLFAAVDVATAQVTTGAGRGEVSMSWSGSEFSTEASNDGHFQNAGVVYFASSGDTGGVNGYPSVSPFVVSAGGTTINRNPPNNPNGTFVSETAWSGSGGGPSAFEPKPTYQSGVAGTSATQRSAPDFSFDANPNTGVSVFDSTNCQGFSGWLVFGGTSVSSPSLAGIVNHAGGFAASSTDELTTIYANRANTADFRDIISGSAGSFSAGVGYDFVTGVGSDQGLAGK